MTDEPNRCEPPADAAYDSHHWLEIDGKLMTARWDPEDRIWSPERMTSFSVNSPFARSHARYLAPVRSHEAVARLVEAAERMDALIPLLRLLTVRQVINAGDAAINAAGLNPWAINEGLARGDEAAVADWRLADFSAALAPFKEPT